MKDIFFRSNLEIFSKKYPDISKRLSDTVDIMQIEIASAADGGICYVVKNDKGKFSCVSNPNNPIESAQKSINAMQRRLSKGLSPAVVVGLAPGYVFDIVYKHFKSRLKFNEPFRRIYVIIDSLYCLTAWLGSSSRTEELNNEFVEFYWHEDVSSIVNTCKNDPQRSHLFIPVSEFPENVVNQIINPLARFYLEREDETKKLLAANNEYYDSLDDNTLSEIIAGKAGRKPRLMMPTHSSSNVVQYSTRDTCEAFRALGWETFILNVERDLPPWRMAKTINDFKPDLFIFINHLRTEDENLELYPRNILFITWIQDAMSAINNRAAADKWNAAAGKNGKRDFLMGYTEQLKKFDYDPSRLFPCGMIVNTNIFKAADLSPEEKAKYGCDVCFASNRSRQPLDMLNDLIAHFEHLGFNAEIMQQIYERMKVHYEKGLTLTSYNTLKDFLVETNSFRELFKKCSLDEQDNIIERIFWDLNDVFYRHIVLKWISETDGIKLNIYGKDWDKNPEFGKYAKGSLAHGEELSKAYRAARYCLHLNALEGAHQRIFEIISSGGTPLIRSKNYDRFSSTVQFSALRKYASASDPEYSKKELGAITDFVFARAGEILALKPNISNEDLVIETAAKLHSCMLDTPDWIIEDWNELKFAGREALFDLIKNKTGKNHIFHEAFINFNERRHVKNVIDTVLKQLNGKSTSFEENSCSVLKTVVLHARALFENIMEPAPPFAGPCIKLSGIEKMFQLQKFKDAERVLCEINPDELVTLEHKTRYLNCLLLSRMNSFTDDPIAGMAPLIDEIYASSSTDSLYTSLAYLAFFERRAYAQIIEYAGKDEQAGRLSVWWKLKLAQVAAARGEENKALEKIKMLYAEYPALTNGFASIGMDYYHNRGDYPHALSMIMRDYENGTLSPQYILNMAVESAFNDQLDEAEGIIADIYSKKSYLRDGYANVARQLYWPQWKFGKCLEWFEKELASGRAMSIENKLYYIRTLAACGKTGAAETVVASLLGNVKAYEAMGEGLCFAKNFKGALHCFEKELELNGPSESVLANLATAFLLCDDYAGAKKLICKYVRAGIWRFVDRRAYWYKAGFAGKPDFSEMLKILDMDTDVHAQRYMLGIIYNIFNEDKEAAELLLKQAGGGNALKLEFLSWKFLIMNEFDELYDYLSAVGKNEIQRECERFWGPPLFLLWQYAFWSGYVQLYDKSVSLFKELHSINYCFFNKKDMPVYNLVMLLGVMYQRLGYTEDAEACHSFSRENAAYYKFELFEKLYQDKNECRLSVPLEFPDFYISFMTHGKR